MLISSILFTIYNPKHTIFLAPHWPVHKPQASHMPAGICGFAGLRWCVFCDWEFNQ
jgi:hypothetical protein